MPGMLSKIFEPEPQDSSGEQRASDGEGEASYSEAPQEGYDSATEAEADAGVALTVPLHVETGVEYETPEGTAGWSQETGVTLTVDTGAALGAASDASFSEADTASY